MSLKPNFYTLLGISRGCSQSEIKTAYKRKALLLHPDKNPSDANATTKFQRVLEAYQTLQDPQKRSIYDATLEKVCRRAKTRALEEIRKMRNFWKEHHERESRIKALHEEDLRRYEGALRAARVREEKRRVEREALAKIIKAAELKSEGKNLKYMDSEDKRADDKKPKRPKENKNDIPEKTEAEGKKLEHKFKDENDKNVDDKKGEKPKEDNETQGEKAKHDDVGLESRTGPKRAKRKHATEKQNCEESNILEAMGHSNEDISGEKTGKKRIPKDNISEPATKRRVLKHKCWYTKEWEGY